MDRKKYRRRNLLLNYRKQWLNAVNYKYTTFVILFINGGAEDEQYFKDYK